MDKELLSENTDMQTESKTLPEDRLMSWRKNPTDLDSLELTPEEGHALLERIRAGVKSIEHLL